MAKRVRQYVLYGKSLTSPLEYFAKLSSAPARMLFHFTCTCFDTK